MSYNFDNQTWEERYNDLLVSYKKALDEIEDLKNDRFCICDSAECPKQ